MIKRVIANRTMLAVLLLIGVAGVLSATAMDLVWFRDVGYPDSASLLRVRDYARNGIIYPNPNRPPYYASLYGPLFYILLSLPCGLAENIDTLRIVARLTILGFWVVSLVLVGLIVYRLSGSTKRASVAMAFACAPGVSAHWTTQIRGDYFGIAFCLLSIYIILGSPSYRRLFFGGVCCALALLCKQTFVAAPFAVLVCLLWRKRFGNALMWTATVCLVTSAGYGAVILREPYAWRELTTFARPIYRFQTGMSIAGQGLWNLAPLFVLLGVFAARRKYWGEKLLLLLYCLLTWIVASTSIVQVGGSTNYFLEPLTASAALASVTLLDVENFVKGMSRKILIPAAMVLLLFCGPLLQTDFNLLADSRFRAVHYAAYSKDFREFSASIGNRQLLSSYPDVTIYSKTPQVPDTLLNSVLAERGIWSWNPIIESLNRSEYELLAMYPFFLSGSGQYRGLSYWNSSMFEAVLRNYQLAGLCAGMEIWTPRHPHTESWRYLATEGCRPPDQK